MRLHLLAAACTACLPATAWAQEEVEAAPDGTFTLGQIVVTAGAPGGIAIGGESLSAGAMEAFQRTSLDDAANLVPGVASSNSGGSRNERLIFVRGFDRFQVPLSIDGVRVYLPADNRLDYGRFLTPDVSEIQIAKGYASVLDGPGAMGGAINLVTRKPTQAIETEARGSVELDGDGDYAGYTAFALLGTRQDQWYAQASYVSNFQDHWNLPKDFAPTATEDGGERDFSRTEDWRVNAKLGFTPNATDEYSLSYTRQEGSKNAPLHITDSLNSQRYWNWPYWNIESLYFLSTTALGDRLTLKTRLYRNTFDNLLRGFDNRNQNSQTLAQGKVFNSWYDDQAHGGSLQLDYATERNRLSIAAHYRRDEHFEYQQTFGASGITEPPQENVEDTWSLAIEDRLELDPTLTLVAGFSYDWRDLKKAEEFASGAIFNYPIVDASTWNAQGQLLWTPTDGTTLRASISSRARFPTVFERFSSRFGGATSNPDLTAERATNLEIGGTHDFAGFRLEGAAFYSWVDDAIVSFPFIYNNTPVSQSRNVGKGEYYGAELAVSGKVSPGLEFGANYTWTKREFTDPSIVAFEATGVPTHKAFIYADWQPVAALHVLPSIELASDRWTVTTNGATYYRTGAFVQASLRVELDVTEQITLAAGVRNAFDRSYTLVDGFPEPGRRFSISVRMRN